MSLPTSYLTSTKNLEPVLNAIRTAKAPSKFTQAFLESLGFKSSSDRLIVGVLKSLGLLGVNGEPTSLYYEFLDQSQSGAVLARAIQGAYADLFAVNVNAQQLTRAEVKNKIKTLTQGQVSDGVADDMAATFEALVKLADFSAPSPSSANEPLGTSETKEGDTPRQQNKTDPRPTVTLGGLVYTIELHLPESRDPAVYDALFQSLRKHLLA